MSVNIIISLFSMCTQGMTPDWSMLKGLALLEETSSSKLVKLFDVRQLPTEPGARFKAVFREKAQWSWTELQPYVEDLQASHLHLCMLVAWSKIPAKGWNSIDHLMYQVILADCCLLLDTILLSTAAM